MNGTGKLSAITALENHGLLCLPIRAFHRPHLVTASDLRGQFGQDELLVVRAATPSEERNLPRLVAATPDDVVAWATRIPPELSLLVQPYEQVLFSVELALYEDMEVAEVIPGIWELDNRVSPVSLRLQGDRIDLDVPDTEFQTARFHGPTRGHHEYPSRVDDRQLATVVKWVRRHRRDLAALHRDFGHSFGLKLHYSARFGLSPQNIRSTVPDPSTWNDAGTSSAEVSAISSTNAPVPTGPVLLDVSIAREEHTRLTAFIDRLRQAGTREVYLRSGMLSHLAINLREAGLTVRSAHG